MSQYHRHLDHDWQSARRETNYALFGNSRGDMKPSQLYNWGPPPTREDRMAERWRLRHIYQVVNQRRNLRSFDQRKMDLAWLRFKEFEQLAWNERGE